MGMLSVFRKLLPAAVFYLLFLQSFSACASIESGIVWLSQQQQNDGGFQASEYLATPYQATSQAVQALNLLDALTPIQKTSAINYLKAQSKVQIEDLSRWILAAPISGESVSGDIQTINSYNTALGGYSDYVGYEHSILATIYALNALATNSTANQDDLKKAINYLMGAQHSDNGWAEQGNLSAIYVTALASHSLQAYRFKFNVGNAIAKATQFLFNNQGMNGGWGSDLDTAIALLAVIPVTVDSSSYQQALSVLRSSQLSNGSWGNDVFTTALALQVFQLAQNAVAIDPTLGGIKGFVVGGNTTLPLANVAIDIQGATNASAVTVQDGRFEVLNLLPGSYKLIYRANGYQVTEQTVVLQNNSLLDVGQVSLPTLTGVAFVSGRITDTANHLPLSGATVQLSGVITKVLTTDENGLYAIEVPLGQLSILISQSGYQSVQLNMTNATTAQVNFSPSLFLTSAQTPPDISIRGTVIDASTQEPLSNAVVRLADNSLSVLSNSEGVFALSGLNAGNSDLVIELSRYQTLTLSAAVVANSVVDVGPLRMSKLPAAQSVISGVVSDHSSGVPIAGAIINAGGVSTTSDATGRYRLEGITPLVFSLSAAATGYVGVNQNFNLIGASTISFNLELNKVITNGVSITNLTADQAAYDADAQVSLTATLNNVGGNSQDFVGQVQVFNEQNQNIEQYAAATSETGEAAKISIASGATKSLPFKWAVQSYPPGNYRILLSVYADQTMQLLDQKEIIIPVKPTAKIASLRIISSVTHTTRGATENIELQAAIRNQSNIPIAANGAYELTDPNGVLLQSQPVALAADPMQLFSTVTLGTLSQLFSMSGNYTLSIRIQNGIQPVLIEAATITVAPDIRIELQQGIDPNSAVPSDSERVKIHIRLKGVEAQ